MIVYRESGSAPSQHAAVGVLRDDLIVELAKRKSEARDAFLQLAQMIQLAAEA